MATMIEKNQAPKRESPSDKLAGAGWGLFFLWIGISILASIPSWVTLFGVGVITLGVQVVRKSMDLGAEGFWITVGALFLAAAVWDLSGTAVQLLPVLLILVGAAILASLFIKRVG